jgi:hypothetical protein
MIVAKHTAELCPGGVVRPDKEFTSKVVGAMNSSGVKLIAGYLNAPNHMFYFVVEAIDVVALNNAVEPLRVVGDVEICPVLEFSDADAWLKNTGIMR